MSTARPSRGTSAERIVAGASTDPMNLPDAGRPSRNILTGAQSQTAQIVSSMEELEDNENADTQSIWIRDADLFETGGLNKSDPRFLRKYHSGFPKKKFTAIAYMPNYFDVIKHRGEEYEFLGYVGEEVAIDEEDLQSFEPYEKGEYSDFFGTNKKLFFNSLAQIARNSPKPLGLYRKVLKNKLSGFDGYEVVEYSIGTDPAESEFFGKIFKAVGKGIKAIGKGVKNAAKWTGKTVKRGVKAVGKGVKNAAKWTGKNIEKVSKFALNNLGMGGAAGAAAMAAGGEGMYDDGSGQQMEMEQGQGFMPYDQQQSYQDENGQSVYAASGSQNSNSPAKNNTILIVAVIAAVVILGGLFIYKSKK